MKTWKKKKMTTRIYLESSNKAQPLKLYLDNLLFLQKKKSFKNQLHNNNTNLFINLRSLNKPP